MKTYVFPIATTLLCVEFRVSHGNVLSLNAKFAPELRPPFVEQFEDLF
jgi:hypothetical protein